MPRRSHSVSQCALNTTIPFGLYFCNKAGQKSLRNKARLPLGPMAANTSSEREVESEKASIGDPWAKKNAGILSGMAGSASRASCHFSRVLGPRDREMFAMAESKGDVG